MSVVSEEEILTAWEVVISPEKVHIIMIPVQLQVVLLTHFPKDEYLW